MVKKARDVTVLLRNYYFCVDPLKGSWGALGVCGTHFENHCTTSLLDERVKVDVIRSASASLRSTHHSGMQGCPLKSLTETLPLPSWPPSGSAPATLGSLEPSCHEGELPSRSCLVTGFADCWADQEKCFSKGLCMPALTITRAFEVTQAILSTASLPNQNNLRAPGVQSRLPEH